MLLQVRNSDGLLRMRAPARKVATPKRASGTYRQRASGTIKKAESDDRRRELETAERRIDRGIISRIEAAIGAAGVRTIANLLSAGREQEAIELILTYVPRIAELFADEFLTAARSATQSAGASFDMTTQAVQTSLRRQRSRLVTEISAAQRAAITEVLSVAATRGLGSINTARMVRDSIGLTSRLEQAVQNYERLLREGSAEALSRDLRDRRFDSSVAAAARGDRVLSNEQIDRMVGRYRQRARQFRAETISRTETSRALGEARAQAAAQIGEQAGQQMVTIWRTARDDRVRELHEPMNGQPRLVRQLHQDAAGNALAFPGDPSAPPETSINCRCTLSILRLSSLSEAQRARLNDV